MGFIGLGAMGLPMAVNLLKAGYTVRGFDLNAAALHALQQAGGIPTASAAAAATGAAHLVLMVVTAAQADCVLFEAAAAAALDPGGAVIIMATCPPAAVQAIAARLAAMGLACVDAPVSGGVVGANAASLTIMAAATAETFAQTRPVLTAMGSKLVHVGTTPGQGAVLKALNQLLAGVHLAAAAEALTLAANLGVDGAAALDILGGAAGGSWMLQDRGPRMLAPDPAVHSAVDIFVKDLGIVLQAGRDSRSALPLAALAHQMFLAAAGQGHGRADDSQVIRAYAALNGPR